MPLTCDLGWHRPDPLARWNHGYYFSKCQRCGQDLVRTAYEGWRVPKGHKIVWRSTPPETMTTADLVPAGAISTAASASAVAAEPAPVPVDAAPAEAAPVGDATAEDVPAEAPVFEGMRAAAPETVKEGPIDEPEPPAEAAAEEPDTAEDAAADEPAATDDAAVEGAPADEPGAEKVAEDPVAEFAEESIVEAPLADEAVAEDPAAQGASQTIAEPLEPELPIMAVLRELNSSEPAPDEEQPVEAEAADVETEARPEAEEASFAGAAERDEDMSEEQPAPVEELAAEPEFAEAASAEPEHAELEGEQVAAPPPRRSVVDDFMNDDPDGIFWRPATEAFVSAPPRPDPESVITETPAQPDEPAFSKMAHEAEPEVPAMNASSHEDAVAADVPAFRQMVEEPAHAAHEAMPDQQEADGEGEPLPEWIEDHTEPAQRPVRPRRSRGWWFGASAAASAAALALLFSMPGRSGTDRPADPAPVAAAVDTPSAPQPAIPKPAPKKNLARAAAPAPAPAQLGQPAYVAASILHCRASPAEQAASVRKLSRGDEVRVLTNVPEWLSVSYDGGQCWLAARYVSPVKPL